MIYSDATNVIAFESYYIFSILQSSIHSVFVWKFASRLKNDLRYTSTDVYQPFPKPYLDDSLILDDLEVLGETYHELRADIMRDKSVGLTELYNRYHNPEEIDKSIKKMRDLHRQIDEHVALAYGWNDIVFEHDFHEVDYLPENDRLRFTVSETSRNEVIERLTDLNKNRYDAEQKELGVVKIPRISTKCKITAIDSELVKLAESKPQMDIFGQNDQ